MLLRLCSCSVSDLLIRGQKNITWMGTINMLGGIGIQAGGALTTSTDPDATMCVLTTLTPSRTETDADSTDFKLKARHTFHQLPPQR